MFRFHVVQAEEGDSLLLEYGTAASPRFLLIDGGPPRTYEHHLRSVLEEVRKKAEALDLAVLSHVDNDHVIGMLDFFAELQGKPANLPRPKALWHNSFADTIDPQSTITPRLKTLLTATRTASMPNAAYAVNGIDEGRSLRTRARTADIPLNPESQSGLVSVETMTTPVTLGNLTVRVVGPTRANLDALHAEWQEWLEKHEDELDTEEVTVLANSDRSVPNLSSIVLLAEADGKRLLLTGDGRSDHLVQGLTQAGIIANGAVLHVDVLKLAHHGSERDVTRKFFDQVTADTYVVSANGRYGNPDFDTLCWIVEAAKARGATITLIATNVTPSTKKLLKKYPPAKHGYTFAVLDKADHAYVLTLAG